MVHAHCAKCVEGVDTTSLLACPTLWSGRKTKVWDPTRCITYGRGVCVCLCGLMFTCWWFVWYCAASCLFLNERKQDKKGWFVGQIIGSSVEMGMSMEQDCSVWEWWSVSVETSKDGKWMWLWGMLERERDEMLDAGRICKEWGLQQNTERRKKVTKQKSVNRIWEIRKKKRFKNKNERVRLPKEQKKEERKKASKQHSQDRAAWLRYVPLWSTLRCLALCCPEKSSLSPTRVSCDLGNHSGPQGLLLT